MPEGRDTRTGGNPASPVSHIDGPPERFRMAQNVAVAAVVVAIWPVAIAALYAAWRAGEREGVSAFDYSYEGKP